MTQIYHRLEQLRSFGAICFAGSVVQSVILIFFGAVLKLNQGIFKSRHDQGIVHISAVLNLQKPLTATQDTRNTLLFASLCSFLRSRTDFFFFLDFKLTHSYFLLLQWCGQCVTLRFYLAVFYVTDLTKYFAGTKFSSARLNICLRKLFLAKVEGFFVRVRRKGRRRRVTTQTTVYTSDDLGDVFFILVQIVNLRSTAVGRFFLSPNFFVRISGGRLI